MKSWGGSLKYRNISTENAIKTNKNEPVKKQALV
jgi:hypothetical protein